MGLLMNSYTSRRFGLLPALCKVIFLTEPKVVNPPAATNALKAELSADK